MIQMMVAEQVRGLVARLGMKEPPRRFFQAGDISRLQGFSEHLLSPGAKL
jgi:hypothetical protein